MEWATVLWRVYLSGSAKKPTKWGNHAWWASATEPNQEEEVNKNFLKQLERGSQLQSLALIEDFNNHDICWEDKIA